MGETIVMDRSTSLARPLMKPLGALALVTLAPVLAACGVAEARTVAPEHQAEEQSAQPAAESRRQCFFARQVTGFRNVRDEDGERVDTHVLVDVGASDTYEFELQRRCPGLRFARGISFVQTGVGRICDGLDVDIIVPDGGVADRCHVTMVRKLGPDDEGSRIRARD